MREYTQEEFIEAIKDFNENLIGSEGIGMLYIVERFGARPETKRLIKSIFENGAE